MTVTKILGAQAGIQYQGVQDKSEADPRDHLINALFTGEFKNGPLSKPFKVTAANIRKTLGFDPDNLQYQAIEDCLMQGVPFVWVMRVSASINSINTELLISPDLQYSKSGVNEIVDGNVILWNIEINGVLYPQKIGWIGYTPDTWIFLEDYVNANQNIFGISSQYEEIENTGQSFNRISNLTRERKFVRLIPDNSYNNLMTFSGNTTIEVSETGIISFWLEPQVLS